MSGMNVLNIGRKGVHLPLKPSNEIAIFRTEYRGTNLTSLSALIRHYQQGTAEVPAAATNIYCKRPVAFFHCAVLSDSVWRAANSAQGFSGVVTCRDFNSNDHTSRTSYPPGGTCEEKLRLVHARQSHQLLPPASNVIFSWRQHYTTSVGATICLIRTNGIVFTVLPRETVTRIKPFSEKDGAHMKTEEVMRPPGPLPYTIDDRLQWPTL